MAVYKTRKFPKELLQDIIQENVDPEDAVLLDDQIIESQRWKNLHEMLFQIPRQGTFQVRYFVGATEMQDEAPFEYDPDEIEVTEMEEREVVKKIWVPVPLES